MHATMPFVVYWAVAFLSLGMAVVLLNVYFGLIGNDLELRSTGKEAAVAGIASLVEAASLWLILSFAPGALRAMIFPVMVVALIYKASHLEDWNRFDLFMLLAFQAAIALMGVSLMVGHFQAVIIILVGFAIFLTVIATFVRNL
jgi:hypothetical protein